MHNISILSNEFTKSEPSRAATASGRRYLVAVHGITDTVEDIVPGQAHGRPTKEAPSPSRVLVSRVRRQSDRSFAGFQLPHQLPVRSIFHKSDGVIIAEIACELVNLGCRLAAGEPGEVGEGYSEAITFCSQPRAMGPNTLEFMILLSTTRSANGSG